MRIRKCKDNENQGQTQQIGEPYFERVLRLTWRIVNVIVVEIGYRIIGQFWRLVSKVGRWCRESRARGSLHRVYDTIGLDIGEIILFMSFELNTFVFVELDSNGLVPYFLLWLSLLVYHNLFCCPDIDQIMFTLLIVFPPWSLIRYMMIICILSRRLWPVLDNKIICCLCWLGGGRVDSLGDGVVLGDFGQEGIGDTVNHYLLGIYHTRPHKQQPHPHLIYIWWIIWI